jgi:hypothetical protein
MILSNLATRFVFTFNLNAQSQGDQEDQKKQFFHHFMNER